MKILVPLVLALVGTGGGIGAGFMLRPGQDAELAALAEGGESGHAASPAATEHASEGHEGVAPGAPEYVKLNNQFVVPVVTDGRISAMVILSLSVEVEGGKTELVYASEPKLRDAFLQLLFDHANMGGFAGAFTSAANMDVLRMSLTEVAQSVLGPVVGGVLVTDIARQDI